MKKKIIISSVVVLVLILGIIGFYIWDNRVISTITLDINPSVEINLKRGNKVKSIKALNSDAKDIISGVKGKKLDKALETLTNNVIEKGYANEGEVVILISSDGNVKNKTIEETLKSSFDKKNIPVEVITIKNITKEDEELAKKYNITPAKASYIKSVVKENEHLEIKDLIDKSVKELNYTKESGLYCNPGYNLDGDRCYKEIERISASNGEVCPAEYNEYNGKCYHETGTVEGKNYTCPEGRTLKDNKCVIREVEEAFKEMVCKDGYQFIDGRCLNLNMTKDKQPGLVCNGDNTRLINDKCVVYDIIGANRD